MTQFLSLRKDWLSTTGDSDFGTLLPSQLATLLGVELLPQGNMHGMQGLGSLSLAPDMGTAQFFAVQDGRVHIRLSGKVAETGCDALLLMDDRFKDARVTRVDVALDVALEHETYGELARRIVAVAADPMLTGRAVATSVAGDWFGGEHGRTLYTGSPTSAVRSRFYEKGVQLASSSDWVRFEWQVRPDTAMKVSGLHLDAPTERYSRMVAVVTDTLGSYNPFSSSERDPAKGGLMWLRQLSLSMLSRAHESEVDQYLQYLSAHLLGSDHDTNSRSKGFTPDP